LARLSDILAARKTILALVAAAALATLGAGCGQDEPDLVNGKTLFIGEGQCGSCHALSRAGTRGTQGPNLDQAFGPARRDGLGESAIAGVVHDQISLVRRNSIMPADLVKGDDARDVSAYVARVAGVPGQDTGELARAGAPKVSNKPVVAENGTLEIAADPTGALAFVARRAEAPAGEVELVMPNEAPVPHNIAVQGGGVDEKGPVVGAGGTSRVSARLDAGKYTFYCSVPGHSEGGMRGELTVE